MSNTKTATKSKSAKKSYDHGFRLKLKGQGLIKEEMLERGYPNRVAHEISDEKEARLLDAVVALKMGSIAGLSWNQGASIVLSAGIDAIAAEHGFVVDGFELAPIDGGDEDEDESDED